MQAPLEEEPTPSTDPDVTSEPDASAAEETIDHEDEEATDADGNEVELDPEAISALAYVVESVLFAAAKPMGIKELIGILGAGGNARPSSKEVRAALMQLLDAYAPGERGIVLHEIGAGFQFRTARENAEFVRQVFKEKPARLGRATLETLAIISYRQPVTKAEIEAVRGVDADGALGTLLARRLIKIAGRKEAIGRPLLYATTPEFLEAFGLKSLKDLPALEELATVLPEEGEYDEEAIEEIDGNDTVATQDDGEEADAAFAGDDDDRGEAAATLDGSGIPPAASDLDLDESEALLADHHGAEAIVPDDHEPEAILADDDESEAVGADHHRAEAFLIDGDEPEADVDDFDDDADDSLVADGDESEAIEPDDERD